MKTTRKVEIFSAGCSVCEEAIAMVRELACSSCDVTIVDMREAGVAQRAKSLGVSSVPAVVIDGRLADCCSGRGPDRSVLEAAGLGQPAV